MLPAIISAPENEPYVAALTYYSTFLLTGSEQEAFRRIPVSTLKLETDFSSLALGTEDNLGDLVSDARAAAESCLTGTLLRATSFHPDTEDVHVHEMRAFFSTMQLDVLAPVNLAEALNVDFHLPSYLYRDVADQKLFKGFIVNTQEEMSSQKARQLFQWADLHASSSKVTPKAAVGLDAPLFKSHAVKRARQALNEACSELRNLSSNVKGSFEGVQESHTIIKQLPSQIRFVFEDQPADLDLNADSNDSNLTGQSLLDLARELLIGRADVRNNCDFSLEELWASRPTSHQEDHSGEHKLASVPSVPFFLLALYWNGTYRDLIRYVLPPFLINVKSLYIETVDLCDSPEDLLYQLCSYLIEISHRGQHEEELLASNVAQMIARNAIGNLAVLRHDDIEETKRQNWVRDIDARVRAAINPIRRRERFAEQINERRKHQQYALRLQERRATDLGAAFHDLRQHVDALDVAIDSFSKKTDELPDSLIGKQELTAELMHCNDDLWVVKAIIAAQMRFAEGKGEVFSKTFLNRYMLEKVFSRLARSRTTARVLWANGLCQCEPCHVTPLDELNSYGLKLPFVSLFSMVKELLRNLIRYGDLSKPAFFHVGIQLDVGKVLVRVENSIPQDLIENRQRFKEQRRNALLQKIPGKDSPREKERRLDEILGPDWLEDLGGVGIEGIFRNYLVRNFSVRSDDEPLVTHSSALHSISYRATNQKLGSVVAESRQDFSGQDGKYSLHIEIDLPPHFTLNARTGE